MILRGDNSSDQCLDGSNSIWALDPEILDECLVSAACPDDEPATGNGAQTEAQKAMEAIDKMPARDRDGAGLDLGILRRQASLGQPFDWRGINGVLQLMSAGALSSPADNAFRQILRLQIEHPTLPINMSGLLGQSPEALISARRLIHAFGQLDTRLDLELQQKAAVPRQNLRKHLEQALGELTSGKLTGEPSGRLEDLIRTIELVSRPNFARSETGPKRELILDLVAATLSNRELSMPLSALVDAHMDTVRFAHRLIGQIAPSFGRPVEQDPIVQATYAQHKRVMESCLRHKIDGTPWLFIPAARGSQAHAQHVDGLFLNVRSGQVFVVEWRQPPEATPIRGPLRLQLSLPDGDSRTLARFLGEQLRLRADMSGPTTLRVTDLAETEQFSFPLFCRRPAAIAREQSVLGAMEALASALEPARAELHPGAVLHRQSLCRQIEEVMLRRLPELLPASARENELVCPRQSGICRHIVLPVSPVGLMKELRLYADGSLVAVIDAAPGHPQREGDHCFCRLGNLSEYLPARGRSSSRVASILAEALSDPLNQQLQLDPKGALARSLGRLAPELERLDREATAEHLRRFLRDPAHVRPQLTVEERAQNLLAVLHLRPDLPLLGALMHLHRIEHLMTRSRMSLTEAHAFVELERRWAKPLRDRGDGLTNEALRCVMRLERELVNTPVDGQRDQKGRLIARALGFEQVVDVYQFQNQLGISREQAIALAPRVTALRELVSLSGPQARILSVLETRFPESRLNDLIEQSGRLHQIFLANNSRVWFDELLEAEVLIPQLKLPDRGALERILAQVNAAAASASPPQRSEAMVRALDKAISQEPSLRAFRASDTYHMRIGRYLAPDEWNPTALRGGLALGQGPFSGRQLTESLICFWMLNELPDHQLATGEIACVAVARAYAGVLTEPRKDGPDIVARFRPVGDTAVVPQSVRQVANQTGPVPLADPLERSANAEARVQAGVPAPATARFGEIDRMALLAILDEELRLRGEEPAAKRNDVEIERLRECRRLLSAGGAEAERVMAALAARLQEHKAPALTATPPERAGLYGRFVRVGNLLVSVGAIMQSFHGCGAELSARPGSGSRR